MQTFRQSWISAMQILKPLQNKTIADRTIMKHGNHIINKATLLMTAFS
jgi:hypothetical protein